MTIKTHGRMLTHNTIGADQLAIDDYGTDNQALVTDGAGTIRWATVGIGGSVGSSTYVEDIRVGDGVTTKFTDANTGNTTDGFTVSAANEESILVFVDGVAQPTGSFTLSSSGSGVGAGGNLDEINITPALAVGQQLRICHLGINTAIADGSITGAKLSFQPAAAGDLLYHNGTQYDRFPIGTAGQLFVTNAGATAPVWFPIGTAGQHLAVNAGATAPEWVTPTTYATEAYVDNSSGGPFKDELLVPRPQATYISNSSNNQVNGIWTKEAGVKTIVVSCRGGGGVAGQNYNTDPDDPSGGSGGSGGSASAILDVRNITTLPYSIGLGGHPQNVPSSAGMSVFGSDSPTVATGSVTVSGGVITGITIISGGSGHTVAPLVNIQPSSHYVPNGTGATATTTITNGVITGATITNGGSGYGAANEVNIFFGLCAGLGGGPGGNANSETSGAQGATGANYGCLYSTICSTGVGGFPSGLGGGAPTAYPPTQDGEPGAIFVRSYK